MFGWFGNSENKDDVIPDDQLPTALTCEKVTDESKAHVCDWDFFKDKKSIHWLNKGDTLFAFKCAVGDTLSKEDQHVVAKVVNVSSFDDEVEENNVPHFDPYNKEQAKEFTCIITKVAYLLPDIPLDALTPTSMTNVNYHKRCQPGNPTIWDDVAAPDTFRMTKKVIPLIFSITIQLKASEVVKKEHLQTLHQLCPSQKFEIDKALLMERTKRNKKVVDATRKAKSVLLYTKVDGGLLVQHYTVVLNSFIPSFAAAVLNNGISYGAAEAAETASLTRKGLKHFAKDGFKEINTPREIDAQPEGRPRADSGY
mmetsp:Transcript_9124/g.13448  ORF Transcript_9124/g.13448 Transcript_9124/m.13448 type:complete len:311 (-) Transcript_9124:151-1083(-)|eukprot:CAMPEP_0175099644 /NCGR_PEP_ID=MMETSP0086_2-20121207/6580_1 /TAXON_ID=136419 /ORGANISM="Unknown Unknown, Strain D1" /LENGTH=310 /DNA_ID=CAMNT_0016373535 /DNA_START=191 /DNA_END=1123 /DNA_ORIENTATION=+